MQRLSTQTHPHQPPMEADLELDAFNAAFEELELDWHWDRKTFRDLGGPGSDLDRISAYLRQHRAHLLLVYDGEALARAILEAKERVRSHTGRHSHR